MSITTRLKPSRLSRNLKIRLFRTTLYSGKDGFATNYVPAHGAEIRANRLGVGRGHAPVQVGRVLLSSLGVGDGADVDVPANANDGSGKLIKRGEGDEGPFLMTRRTLPATQRSRKLRSFRGSKRAYIQHVLDQWLNKS